MQKHPDASRISPPGRISPPETRDGALDCPGAEPLLDAYLDGELAAAEATSLETHLEGCAACSRELELARRVQDELHAMPLMSCPPAVTQAVLGHAEAHPPLFRRLRRLWTGRRAWQPAFALLVVAALGVASWRLTAPAPPVAPQPAEPIYTEAEIAQAEAELKMALALIGEIGQKARYTVGAELSTRVVTPITRSIAGSLMLQPLGSAKADAKGGGKAEHVS